MFNRFRACLCPLVSTLVLAGCANKPPSTIDEPKQLVSGGREALVTVPQGEINATYNPSVVGGASFGLIGALVDAGINQSRASSAESAVQPLRDALVGYDFDRKAVEATRQAAAGVPWIQAKKVAFSKEASPERIGQKLDEAKAPQVVIVSYSYNLLTGYDRIGVNWTVSLVPTAKQDGQTPQERLDNKNVLYRHAFSCERGIAGLPDEEKEKIAVWAKDRGAKARAVLDSCLAKVDPLLRRSLSMSAAEEEALMKGESIKQGDRKGPLVLKDADGAAIATANDAWLYVAGDSP